MARNNWISENKVRMKLAGIPICPVAFTILPPPSPLLLQFSNPVEESPLHCSRTYIYFVSVPTRLWEQLANAFSPSEVRPLADNLEGGTGTCVEQQRRRKWLSWLGRPMITSARMWIWGSGGIQRSGGRSVSYYLPSFLRSLARSAGAPSCCWFLTRLGFLKINTKSPFLFLPPSCFLSFVL